MPTPNTSANRPLTPAALARVRNARGERGPHPIPRRRHVASQFHRIFSIKAGMRIAVAEGRLQAMAILWAEGEPSIVSLCEQPLRIHRATRSAPFMTLDLSVKHANGQEVIYAIRPTKRLIARDDGRVLPEHWEAIEAWGNHNGIHFDVLTDDRLDRDKIRIANWRALLGFVRQARENPAPELEAELLSIIQAHAGISVTSLADHVTGCDEQTLVAHVANLLHQGRMDAQLSTISFNRYSPLTVSTHA